MKLLQLKNSSAALYLKVTSSTTHHSCMLLGDKLILTQVLLGPYSGVFCGAGEK